MPFDLKSLAATSLIFWIVVAYLLMKYGKRFGLPGSPKLLFWGTVVFGLFFTGVGASFLSPGSVVGSKSSSAGSSDALGDINVLGVGATVNNYTVQDTSNPVQLNYRSTVANLQTSGYQNDVNGTFTIERTGGQAATCLVKAMVPSGYNNPSDTTDTKTYRLVSVDSFGKSHVYFDSDSYQEQKYVGFGEGVTSVSVTLLARLDYASFTNITNYNSKTLTVDVCGKKTIPVVITRTG